MIVRKSVGLIAIALALTVTAGLTACHRGAEDAAQAIREKAMTADRQTSAESTPEGKSDPAGTVAEPLDQTAVDAMGFETEGAWRSATYFLEDNPTFKEADLLAPKTVSLTALNSGVTLSEEHVKEGRYAGKWANHPYYPTISTRLMATDWSAYQTISLWIYSETDTNEAISLIAYSDNSSTYWKEFYYYTFRVNWTGWKQLEIPLTAFTPYGKPAGWQHIQQLSLSTKAFAAQPNPYTVLYLDAIRLQRATAEQVNRLLADLPQPAATARYITKYPAELAALTLDDYLQFVNNKLEFETAAPARRAELQAENDALLARYGLGTDTYALSQFVETMPPISTAHDIVPFDPNAINHRFPELRDTPPELIKYGAYWNNERALYGYYPRFNSAPVSLAPDGHPYLLYGDSVIETYNAAKDAWYFLDLEPIYQQYASQTFGWSQYRHRDDNFYEEVKIRFDRDGDAYLMAAIARADGKGTGIVGLLLYSNDKMKTWQVYRLPHPFGKFEEIDTFNTDALNRPPVITLHNEWVDPLDQSGYLLLPEKLPDGTLRLPVPIKYCDYCLKTAPHHSGDANIALTAGGKIFLVYGVIDMAQNPDVRRIPADAPANRLSWTYKGATNESRSGTPAFIVAYDLRTGQLSDSVFLGYGGRALDEHNWPSLTIGSDGHLHAFINGHHDPTFYTSSLKPYDIGSWTAPQLINNGNSYSAVAIDKHDTLYLITRNSEDGYRFHLSLSRKKPGQSWEPARPLVERFKPYYENWQHKLTIDPDTGKLFLTYFGQSRQVQIFKDEYDAQMYIWPDREKATNPDGKNTPVGTYADKDKQNKMLTPTPSEPVTLVSVDGGDTWHLSQSEDYAQSLNGIFHARS